jgi:hypothetical protein
MIFADPRGGSTWLTEQLLSATSAALIWEPLHIKYNKFLRDQDWNWRQVITPDYYNQNTINHFDKILSGRLLNEWTLLQTTTKDCCDARHLMIKFCRGNGILPWLVEQFDFTYKPVLLLRHPMAVVASQLKHGGWSKPFQGFNINYNMPQSNLYKQHEAFLNTIKTKEASLIVSWCLANSNPLNSPNSTKWLTLYYEDLVRNPVHEFKKITDAWGVNLPQDFQQEVKQPSSTTLNQRRVIDPDALVNRWQNEFSSYQLDEMQNVLDYFDIIVYSKNSASPNKTVWSLS